MLINNIRKRLVKHNSAFSFLWLSVIILSYTSNERVVDSGILLLNLGWFMVLSSLLFFVVCISLTLYCLFCSEDQIISFAISEFRCIHETADGDLFIDGATFISRTSAPELCARLKELGYDLETGMKIK